MTADEVWQAMSALIGTWDGGGVGYFPTIDDFSYRETVLFAADFGSRQLRFEQTSWRKVAEGERESHTEVGYVAVDDDGRVEMTVAEAVDRVEVLVGAVDEANGRHVLEVSTVAVAHDERVVRSWRKLTFDAGQIDYTMGMATTAVTDGAPHLEGSLTRRA